ncbi:MLO-like protein 4 [Dionaea muscipula]
MDQMLFEGRSLAETPTWSVATVTTVMVFVCFLVERGIYRLGKWLKSTRKKALLASLEKVKEELMLLGLISLMLGQCAKGISEICIDSSVFDSRFFLCSEEDFSVRGNILLKESLPSLNETPGGLLDLATFQCAQGQEPFVSYEGLEQLHRFLFVLGITRVLYSCVAVGLAMTKIYSWKKWEFQTSPLTSDRNWIGMNTGISSSFAIHHASHAWNRNPVLIWMLCFIRQFKSSIQKSDYLVLRARFISNHRLPLTYNFHRYMIRSMEDEFHAIVGISWPLWGYAILCILFNVHGLNIYFWLSFIPAVLVILVGTKLEHVVSKLALEIAEPTNPSPGAQFKPRDELFWFGKPEIMLKLIQFITFQNSFEMAGFIWSLWALKRPSCYLKNHTMVIIRLTLGVLVQFWCSYSTVPLSIIITQMGSKTKPALVAESVRDSLHSWCRRVKEKSRHSHAARSVCSIDEGDETMTVASLTLSPCSSVASLNELTTIENSPQPEAALRGTSASNRDAFSFRISEYISQAAKNSFNQPPPDDGVDLLGSPDHGMDEVSFRISKYISQSAENTFSLPPDVDTDLKVDVDTDWH